MRLAYDIATKQYRHGGYDHKIINEKKRRDIHVASVRDRIIHRLLYDYLMPLLNPRFDDDVWSCRPGKGLHGALQRTQQLTRRYATSWVYRGDVKKFFDSVDHDVLLSIVRRHVSDETTLWLLSEVINSYRTAGQPYGMPIGNLTSQLFANMYLNEFDRFVRHHIKPLAYVRYGDDFSIFFRSRQEAVAGRVKCIQFLEKQLLLTIHQHNNVIVKANQGLHFLGHHVYPRSVVANRALRRKIRREISAHNASSYLAQLLPRRYRRDTAWRLVRDMYDTYDE